MSEHWISKKIFLVAKPSLLIYAKSGKRRQNYSTFDFDQVKRENIHSLLLKFSDSRSTRPASHVPFRTIKTWTQVVWLLATFQVWFIFHWLFGLFHPGTRFCIKMKTWSDGQHNTNIFSLTCPINWRQIHVFVHIKSAESSRIF